MNPDRTPWASSASGLQAAEQNTQPTTQQQLEDLQMRVAFMDDLLDELNRMVARQQDQILALQREVFQLRRQSDSGAPPAFQSLRDELPPHY